MRLLAPQGELAVSAAARVLLLCFKSFFKKTLCCGLTMRGEVGQSAAYNWFQCAGLEASGGTNLMQGPCSEPNAEI